MAGGRRPLGIERRRLKPQQCCHQQKLVGKCFSKINVETSGVREGQEEVLQTEQLLHVSLDDDDKHVIGILQDGTRGRSSDRMFQNSDASLRSCWRTSATKMKRYGERGSPCRRPFLQRIHFPGVPFRRTAVWLDWRMCLIQRHQMEGKFLASKMRSKASHSMESKAFLKSSFREIEGILRLRQV